MDIQKIIAKLINDTASIEELEILEAWKKESENNVRELQKMIDIQKSAAEMEGYKDYNIEGAWNNIEPMIDSNDNYSHKTRSLFPRIAVGIAASFILAFSAYYFLSDKNITPTEYVASIVQESITLPDGSNVVLDIESRINISEDFMNDRSLILEGRAYFSVIHMENDNPFTVTIPDATITVIGTEFSVSTNGEDSQVSVESGRVEVAGENRRVQLGSGDLLLIEDNNFINLENRSPNYFSWKDKTINFDDAQLSNILTELSWIYNTTINIDAIQKISTCRLTTEYNNMSLENILAELKSQIDLDYTYKEGGIVVNDVNCT